jgi:hypothetical protein
MRAEPWMNKTQEQAAREARVDDARAKAEIAIQRVLLDLEAAACMKIEEVSVDTRNFASLNVEIFFREPRPAHTAINQQFAGKEG